MSKIEDPLEPNLPICDPHHHVWDRPNSRYLLDQILEDMRGGHNIVSTVFLECSWAYREDGPEALRPVGETEYVDQLAAQTENGSTAVAAGIVGFAELSLGEQVIPVLEAHLAASPERFRGIRRSTAADASPDIRSYKNPPLGLLLDATFREGFACLQRYDLSFDAGVYHHQLTELADLARAFPETMIILNHIGGPLGIGSYAGQRETVFQVWRTGMAEVAACPNVVVKLGGLGMPNYGHGWHERPTPPGSAELAEVMSPYFMWCIEQFGVERCMFESNFPVDNVSYSYITMWNAFKRVTQGFSTEERAALFHDTAARVYRLAQADSTNLNSEIQQ